MKSMKIFGAVLALAISATAFAQESRIVVAADSSSGTYNKMLGEIIQNCSDDNFSIVPAQGVTGGAPGNLDALVNNKAQAAFMHHDVFLSNSMGDPSYARFQTLVALYPEPIHVITLAQSKTKIHLVQTVDFNKLDDLKGYKVGAAGGGVYTARILQGQGQGGFEVVAYDKGDQVIAALQSNEIQAAIFVGAAPLPNLEKLPAGVFKLIPIGDAIGGRVATVYRPATLNYKNMTQGQVKTLAPLAVIMTRKYTTPAKLQAQAHFRACFNKALPTLQDEGSPNWQSVEANDHGISAIPYYELPVVDVSPMKPAKK